MARYKSVDQDRVLDAAETMVRSKGIHALTFDALAKAAGISKGGVQSSFGTKDQLVKAMFDRWVDKFEASVESLADGTQDPMAWLSAYIEATYRIDKTEGDCAATMGLALMDHPGGSRFFQDWYKKVMKKFDFSTPEGRRARIAFIANEGVFMLRFGGVMKISQAEWKQIFADLQALVSAPESLR